MYCVYAAYMDIGQEIIFLKCIYTPMQNIKLSGINNPGLKLEILK